MMVGNDIRHDTRVLKTALALADGGVEVRILGYSSSGVREESALGPVRIVRVPVAWRFRDQAAARRKQRRDRRWIAPEPSVRDRRLRRLQLDLRRREAAESGDRASQVRAGLSTTWAKVSARLETERGRLSRKEAQLRQRAAARADASVRGASWRRDAPEMDDYALAFDPVIDSLDWDIIHAHDVHMMGIASRAVSRRRAAGRPAAWVYDAHEFVAGLSVYPPRTARKVAALLDLESEYIHDADAVITVTQPLAVELEQRYRLPRRPAVVMNVPVLEGAASVPVGLRARCELADDVPLLVYSGGVTAARGLATAVEALPLLPRVHLAVVCVPHTRVAPARDLMSRADELGVAGRVHLVEPVPPDAVSSFVASADVGIVPILHFGSHEMALANKLFEYLYAGIPVLVSDCRAQAEFVLRERVGAVHVAGDPESFARSAREVLGQAAGLRASIAANTELLVPYSWERQEQVLREAYRGLYRAGLPGGAKRPCPATGEAGIAEPKVSSALAGLREHPLTRDDRPSVVGIGPANMAGQAWEWAKALEREIPGVGTHVMVVDRGQPYSYPSDATVPAATYRRNANWAQAFEGQALAKWTHALLEAGRPLFGLRHGDTFAGDAKVLRGAGVRVGLVLHGSEVRNPVINVMQTPWSPFTSRIDEQTRRLQAGVDTLVPQLRAFMDDELMGGPVFVSTPDLLRHLPGAIWLPVAIDTGVWACDAPLLEREVPVVLHAPSRSSLKGSSYVEAAMAPLAAEGLVEYRRAEGIAPGQMPELVKDADIVLDQFALGLYGVAACEAMMAGRLVVSHVTDEVRQLCPSDPPILEAPPDQLEAVLRQVLADRDRYRQFASAGPAYVRELHDGRRSAQVLAEHLGIHG